MARPGLKLAERLSSKLWTRLLIVLKNVNFEISRNSAYDIGPIFHDMGFKWVQINGKMSSPILRAIISYGVIRNEVQL